MTRTTWSTVLITVVLLVTLSRAGTWLLPSITHSPPRDAEDPVVLAPASRGEHALRATGTLLRGWSQEVGARVAATSPEDRRMALAALLGITSLGVLLRGIAVAVRRQRDRRPTPTTPLGPWTRRTGLARDAARFLMTRHQRQDLPPTGSGVIAREGHHHA